VPVLQLGGNKIEYSVMHGTSRRYTYFRFKSDKTLVIVVPKGRRIDLEATIKSRRAWILKHFEEISRNRRVLDDESVMFDGDQLRIVFEEDHEKEELQPAQEKGEVVVRASERSRVGELVRRWFLRETSRYVVRKLSELSTQVPLHYRRADVRQMKNWGYCTRDGHLSFSWQLIALPERLREYIIFHEVAHLSELNHSGAFKRKLAAICPDYRERERELDQIVPL
jgi:predicted metal-dependent hydrolase